MKIRSLQFPASWHYLDQTCNRLLDPRSAVSKQTAWVRPKNNVSSLNGCEPDNYNFAVFDDLAHDFTFIQDQCFYYIDDTFYGDRIKGWISMYVCSTDEQEFLFNREVNINQPRAVWRQTNFHPVRQRAPMLNATERPTAAKKTITFEERLWQTGYYKNMENKYFSNSDKFAVMIGTPRGMS